jgi:DNA primase
MSVTKGCGLGEAWLCSWAADYLTERLGSDLSDDARFQVGYAPPAPTNLIQHLTGRGAGTEELVDAGFARKRERGRLVGTFRDRLVFPIYSGSDLVGFVGRRNPTKSDSEFSGPKYPTPAAPPSSQG